MNRPTRRPKPAQQLVDHPRRRRLAVGAGHLDDGHRAVRRTEQVDQRVDAGQRRLEPALRPARQQLLLHAGHVTGARSLLIAPRMPAPPDTVRRPSYDGGHDTRHLAPGHQLPREPGAAYPRSRRSTGSRRSGSRRWAAEDTYAFDRAAALTAAARADLLDRHPAADGQRLAARRARLQLHPHRHHRPLPAHARQRRLLPDGLGRQRPADRAPGAELLRRPLRPVAALRPRLRAAARSPARTSDPDLAGATSSSCATRLTAEDEQAFEELWRRARPVGRLVADATRRSATRPARIAQRAFLRNLARGEAYQAEAPTLWDVDVPHRGRAGRARGPRAARRLPPHRVPPAPTATADRHRDHPARAARRRASRSSPTPTTSATSRCSARRCARRCSASRCRSSRTALADPDKGIGHRDDLHVRRHSPTSSWWRELQLPTRAIVGCDGRILRRPARRGSSRRRPRGATPSSPARP